MSIHNSLWCHGYNTAGLILDHTWARPNNLLTWEAAAVYLDEAHLVIDSVNTWKKKAATPAVRKALNHAARRCPGCTCRV